SSLFDKINLNVGANLTPYQRDPVTGAAINRYVWDEGSFRLGTLNSVNVSLSTSFQSKPRDEKKAEEREEQQQITDPSVLADQQRMMEYMRRNPAEFVDFNIPWSVNLSYGLTIMRRMRPNFTMENTVQSSAQINGSFSLTPKWNFSTNASYDFNEMKIQMLTLSISRDMHCWQMSIGVTPVGLYPGYNLTINPKASILQDLRVNRSRYFYNY
ncbi:MAG TPA: LPS-assembly protein LptD, partial [Chitinophagaceae bacterium]|nr:LPS-assembly protein LptD [Chitinophagaceae bacterium]